MLVIAWIVLVYQGIFLLVHLHIKIWMWLSILHLSTEVRVLTSRVEEDGRSNFQWVVVVHMGRSRCTDQLKLNLVWKVLLVPLSICSVYLMILCFGDRRRFCIKELVCVKIYQWGMFSKCNVSHLWNFELGCFFQCSHRIKVLGISLSLANWEGT